MAPDCPNSKIFFFIIIYVKKHVLKFQGAVLTTLEHYFRSYERLKFFWEVKITKMAIKWPLIVQTQKSFFYHNLRQKIRLKILMKLVIFYAHAFSSIFSIFDWVHAFQFFLDPVNARDKWMSDYESLKELACNSWRDFSISIPVSSNFSVNISQFFRFFDLKTQISRECVGVGKTAW